MFQRPFNYASMTFHFMVRHHTDNVTMRATGQSFVSGSRFIECLFYFESVGDSEIIVFPVP